MIDEKIPRAKTFAFLIIFSSTARGRMFIMVFFIYT